MGKMASAAAILGVFCAGCGGSGAGLSAGDPAPTLSLSTGAISLHAMNGGAAVQGSCTVSVHPAADWSASSSAPAWCTVTPSGASGTAVTVTADPTGLPNGANAAAVTVSSPDLPDQTLNVTLTVHQWTLSPTTVSLTAEVDGAAVSDAVTVTTDPAQAWNAASDQTWCTFSIAADTLTITADPTGLAEGAYAATVTVTSVNMDPATIPVAFDVQSVGISTGGVTEMTFRALEGDTTAQQGVCTVTTDPVQDWTAAVENEQPTTGWCSVTSGGASGTDLTVTVDPTGLSRDTYTATVRISSAGIPDATVSVTLLMYGPPGWLEMTAPGGVTNLRGVHGTAYDNIYAVGDGGMVLYYDGSSWTEMNHGLSTDNFYDVWAVDESNVFAAAYGGTILHYDGSSWSAMNSGTTAITECAVWGSSPTDVHVVWCAGHIRYDGTSWSPSDGVGCAYGVNGSSSTDIWTCGSGGRRDHWNGGTWDYFAGTDGTDPAQRTLEDVWALPGGHAFFVGRGNATELKGPFIHYDNGTWTVYDVAFTGVSPGTDLRLFGVWAESPTSVWICGERNQYVAIYHFDGAAASLQANVSWPLGDFTWTRLEGIWGVTGPFTTTELFIVGWNATILRYGPMPPP